MSSKSHGTHVFAWLLFIAVMGGLLYGFYFIRHLGMAPRAMGEMPPAQVLITKPDKSMVKDTYREVGQTEAVNRVELKARVRGVLAHINFVEGSQVNKGDVLFEIQKDEYIANVASAKAALSDAKAEQDRAHKYLRRLQKTAKGGVSEKVMDDAINAEKKAVASVEKAVAAVKVAELNLEYTTVTAPISGRIGKANFTTGNVVEMESGALATIVQVSPIYAVFAIGEDKALTITSSKADVTAADIFLELSNGKRFEYSGKLVFMDNNINDTSGTVLMRATFPNPDGLLMPGQFVNVIVQRPEERERLAVPGASVLQDQAGSYVLTVLSDNRVNRTAVTTGNQIDGGLVEIKGGLKGDESIIYQGMEKAPAGSTVAPQTVPFGQKTEAK